MNEADWYYIGHYGQLGPLTREQVDDLIDGGVIERDTYVWRNGMSDWLPAERVAELQSAFRTTPAFAPPPPPASRPTATITPAPPVAPAFSFAQSPVIVQNVYPVYEVRSDKSRVLAGLLQFLPPGGLGRIYLGYAAIGVLQLVLSFCVGLGYVWSIIDGVIILTGGTNRDGYGRVLPD